MVGQLCLLYVACYRQTSTTGDSLSSDRHLLSSAETRRAVSSYTRGTDKHSHTRKSL